MLNKKQKECRFCHGRSLDKRQALVACDKGFKQGYILIGIAPRSKKLVLKPSMFETDQINYCPMCGRKLKGESDDN